jgi:hypothetical protein
MTVHFSGPVVSAAGFSSGDATTNITIAAAGKLSSSYATSTATSGDVRLNYDKLTFTGAGAGGEVGRDFAVVTVAGAAVGGTINGRHVTLSVDGSGTISGAGNAMRATIGGSSTNPGGTLAAMQLDSDFATGGTWSNASFLRATNSGTGVIDYFATLPTTGSGLMVAPHTTQVLTDSIRIKLADGTVRYIMLTTLASNRTGGA